MLISSLLSYLFKLYGSTWMAIISSPETRAFTHVPSTAPWVEYFPVTVDLWDSEGLQLSTQMVGKEDIYVLSVTVASHATLPSNLHNTSCTCQNCHPGRCPITGFNILAFCF